MKEDHKLFILIGMVMLLCLAVGLMVGYYIGLNVATDYFLPKLTNCVSIF